MPIETPTGIWDLVPEWPLGTDPQLAGDDHLRAIKAALQATFPQITTALTAPVDNVNRVTNQIRHWPAVDDGTTVTREAFAAQNDDLTAFIEFKVHNPAPDVMTSTAWEDAVNWGTIINVLYPVGRVLLTTRADNPSSYLGFGTWTQRQAGVLYSAGVSDDGHGRVQNLPVGNVGGWWQVNHEMIVPRGYQFDGATITDAPHAHTIPAAAETGGGSPAFLAAGGNGTIVETNTDGHHNHNVRVSGNIGLGSDNHRAPGVALYVWERTA